ncbi:MAG TPA: hypothetical protein VG709_02160, partial [Actinomycetota bacterium]|nr:hypothetical protein [Actinomycetota bacterium]
DRRPTDWERNVARLETAEGITADMAIRRDALEELGGFDERFRRAYREDTDLMIRMRSKAHRLANGRRTVLHPVRPASRWISVSMQRGNADDALMYALHGRSWADGGRWSLGTRRAHIATTVAGLVAVAAVGARARRLAAVAGGAWAVATGALAWKRIRPGPRDPDEITTMIVTSAAIPPAATYWWVVGLVRRRGSSSR